MKNDIGTDRQLFVDDYWIEDLDGIRRTLHHPVKRETVIRPEHPWEQKGVSYMRVIEDGGRFRGWYRCDPKMNPDMQDRNTVTAYAESFDGVTWEKPTLGIVEYDGSKENNIVWAGADNEMNMAPFRDKNPVVSEDEKYKAIIRKRGEVIRGLVSPDGIHWRLISEEPFLTDGPFDSHNIAFWDTNLSKYVAYTRGIAGKGDFEGGVRWVRRALSDDFVHWSKLESIDVGDEPDTHFYTNSCVQYDRAPGVYLMFPSRYVPDRWPVPDWEYGPGVNDIVFLSSRDGIHFDFSFREAFVRPGTDSNNWHERAIYMEWGVLQTSPTEISLYGMENWRMPTVNIRRYTLRTDGFVSLSAGFEGGTATTRPFIYSGNSLELNYATSAVGSVQVELRDETNHPIPGFSIENCPERFGDEIDGEIRWSGMSALSAHEGKPVRLHFRLKDADVYAFRFR